MRKNIIIGVILVIVIGIIYFAAKKEAIAPVVVPPIVNIDLTEKANVENYLRKNISKLSPIEAVLGGTWYVVSDTVDLEKSSGTVEYEDGHISETKNFTYTTNQKGEVVSLIIN